MKGGEFMNRIKELRKERGLSLEQLSHELGKRDCYISSSSLSKYERGVRNPKIENWIALANYFAVSISYLQGKSNEKNPINEDNLKVIRNYHYLQKYQNNIQDLEDFDDSHIDDELKALIGSMVETFNTNLYFLLPEKNTNNTEKAAITGLYYSLNNLMVSLNKYIGRIDLISIEKKLSEMETSYLKTLLWLNAIKIFNNANESIDEVNNKTNDELIEWIKSLNINDLS